MDPQKASALFLALKQEDLYLVETLLAEDASLVHARSPAERTPLHTAARRGIFRAVELLLEAGAELNAADGRGWTPLDWALEEEQTEVAEFLRSKGALEGKRADTP